MITISYHDDSYIQISAEKSVQYELKDHFRFRVPGFVHMPLYKKGIWDGYYYFFNLRTRLIYTGLLHKVVEFFENRGYEYELEGLSLEKFDFSEHEADIFFNLLNSYEPRDYQKKAFIDCIRRPRQTIVMPTGSGKSFVIYSLLRYYNQKSLVIVPTLGLIHQLTKDFQDYGYDEPIHQIFNGKEKSSDAKITISTWQSLQKLDEEYFQQYKAGIVDECHQAKAKELTSIVTNLSRCPIKFGFTGTLDDKLVNTMILEGLFGPINKITTSAELIEQQHLAKFDIKCCNLKYPKETCQLAKDLSYQEEVDFIITNEQRNKFIANLALSLKDNTLITFRFVEKHGHQLYDLLKNSGRTVYYIDGSVAGEERDDIRQLINQQNDAILIGSEQTISTGINIPRLKNIIFASPSKSRIRVMQSIGRVLRTTNDKRSATLFDISDDLSFKKHKNYTLGHFIQRVEMYSQEKFPFKLYNIRLS